VEKKHVFGLTVMRRSAFRPVGCAQQKMKEYPVFTRFFHIELRMFLSRHSTLLTYHDRSVNLKKTQFLVFTK